MRKRSEGHFLSGLASGLLLGLLGLLLLGSDRAALLAPLISTLEPLWQLAENNLRGSMPLFTAVLVFYIVELAKLRSLLAEAPPAVASIARHEQLLDLCASLFFGIGVIWTAIGMRDALLFALGDPGGAASQGAFEVLERLVDGGILLALSTTIVGGIGGYLMRAGKSLWLGQQLAALYMQAADAPAQENLAILQRIEQHLDRRRPADNDESLAP